jgi:4,5-dihydroxyphthalate decarboxylase
MSTMTAEKVETLNACFGNYRHTQPLKNGVIKSDRMVLRFTEVEPINKAFLQMVRQEKFDVSEMALATYLQAKAYGKPLVLLPATMMGRFQHGTMLYNAERGRLTPENLAGRRIGVRSFAQTTGVWLRGILWKDYGLDLGKVKWVTFEDAHLAEFRDPPGVERAPDGKDMTKMVLEGELDAAIFGGSIPTDPRLKSVIADPDAAAGQWHKTHGTVPLNHMIVVKNSVSQTDPGAVREIFRMLQESKKAAGLPKPGAVDTLPFGYDAVKPALDLLSSYALEMKIIPRRYEVDELFDGPTRAL